MSTAQSVTHKPATLSATFGRRILAGVLGGLAGGVVFGMLMAMMGMLTTIASMIGSDSPWVGFGMHLMISVLIGLGLTILFGNRLLTGYGRGLLVGMVYGAIWWVLGPLVMMPLMLGMPVFSMDMTTIFSLMGHLIYGAILGLVAVRILKSRA
jgi:uncharacterized membrane protein YagU involved in acid resistance